MYFIFWLGVRKAAVLVALKIALAMLNNFVCIPICPNFTMHLYLLV
jgi:hypothetical protein